MSYIFPAKIIAEGLEAQRQFARDMLQGLSEP